jgi:hypothetical protein
MKLRPLTARWLGVLLVLLLLIVGFATLGERLGVRTVARTMLSGTQP